jgi:threonine dehydrogenase-like Zn-dependent dehydrogenase
MHIKDLHEYLGGPILIPTTPHPITGEKLPLTLGHEFGGVIEEVGSGVRDIVVGERVVVQPIIYDGTCGACAEGFINCCDKNGFVGLSGECFREDILLEPAVMILANLKFRLGWWVVGSCRSPSSVRL